MSNIFKECFSILSFPDISEWKSNNVINMSYLFYGCISTVYLTNISKWNTSNEKNSFLSISK